MICIIFQFSPGEHGLNHSPCIWIGYVETIFKVPNTNCNLPYVVLQSDWSFTPVRLIDRISCFNDSRVPMYNNMNKIVLFRRSADLTLTKLASNMLFTAYILN